MGLTGFIADGGLRCSGAETVGLVERVLLRTFGRPAGILGRIGGRVMARTNDEVAEWVVSLLDVDPDSHVLEVGFGPGVGIAAAARAVPEGSVSGIDSSRVMVEQATRRNDVLVRSGRVALEHGSVDALPYEDESFDAAFSVNSLQVWPDPIGGLGEVRRVLNPGGAVAVAFTPHSGYSADELPDTLVEAGFERVRVERDGSNVCALAVEPPDD